MGELDKNKKTMFEMIYEGIMFVLAFIAVATIWYQTQYDSVIVWGTWAIFFIDFLIRFFSTKQKWAFIKANPFIIIAIIPLDAIFQLARAARLLHFLRLKTITKYYAKPIITKLENQRLSKIIPFGFLILFVSIVPLFLYEPSMETYGQAFLGGLASLVYFGYSAVNPQTTVGTIIITMLTIFGVIMHGLILSYLFSTIKNSKFLKGRLAKRKKRRDYPL